MRWTVLLISFIAIVGCGAVIPSSAQSGLPCSAQTTGLLTADQLPSGLTQESEWSRPILGLLANGDAAYPGFVGRSGRTFLWNGLYSGTPRALVNNAWSDLHYTGSAPLGFIPNTGPLFTAYPGQVFQVAESTMDFGNVQGAQKWLNSKRSLYQENSDPETRSGVTMNPPTARIGDDTFTYQISMGPSGKLKTDIQSRVGPVVYGLSIDSGPQYAAVPNAVGLMTSLYAKERATCPSA